MTGPVTGGQIWAQLPCSMQSKAWASDAEQGIGQ
jgi:hypothetical protein